MRRIRLTESLGLLHRLHGLRVPGLVPVLLRALGHRDRLDSDGGSEGPQHLDQLQGALRRLLALHGGGHGVPHHALPVQDHDPLQGLPGLLVIEVEHGGQLTTGVGPDREVEAAPQSSVLPGGPGPAGVDLGTVGGAGHDLAPGHREPRVESVEGEEELLGDGVPVSGVEDDDEVLAEVLGQAVGRLAGPVHTGDVARRARSWTTRWFNIFQLNSITFDLVVISYLPFICSFEKIIFPYPRLDRES